MTRPPDWPAHALAWFRGLSGEQRKAVVLALDPEGPAGQMFARLTYAALDDDDDEQRAKIFAKEAPVALEEFRTWLRKS